MRRDGFVLVVRSFSVLIFFGVEDWVGVRIAKVGAHPPRTGAPLIGHWQKHHRSLQRHRSSK